MQTETGRQAFRLRRPFLAAALPVLAGSLLVPLGTYVFAETSGDFGVGIVGAIGTYATGILLAVAWLLLIPWLWRRRNNRLATRNALFGGFAGRYFLAVIVTPVLWQVYIAGTNIMWALEDGMPLGEVLVESFTGGAGLLMVAAPFAVIGGLLMLGLSYLAFLLLSVVPTEAGERDVPAAT